MWVGMADRAGMNETVENKRINVNCMQCGIVNGEGYEAPRVRG